MKETGALLMILSIQLMPQASGGSRGGKGDANAPPLVASNVFLRR